MSTAVAEGRAVQRYPGRALFSALFVTLIGPLLGGLAVFVFVAGTAYISALNSDVDAATQWTLSDAGQLAGMVTVYAYMFGIIQAAVAGIVFAFHVYFRGRVRTLIVLLATILGVIVLAGFYKVMVDATPVEGADPTPFIETFAGLGITMGIIGFVAAMLCKWLLGIVFRIADRGKNVAPA